MSEGVDHTVVGFHKETNEIWVGHVKAHNYVEAIQKAIRACDSASDLQILSVFRAKLPDLNQIGVVVAAGDFPLEPWLLDWRTQGDAIACPKCGEHPVRTEDGTTACPACKWQATNPLAWV